MVQNNQESRCKYWATFLSVHLFPRTAHFALLALLERSAALTRKPARSLTHSRVRGMMTIFVSVLDHRAISLPSTSSVNWIKEFFKPRISRTKRSVAARVLSFSLSSSSSSSLTLSFSSLLSSPSLRQDVNDESSWTRPGKPNETMNERWIPEWFNEWIHGWWARMEEEF